MPKACHWWTSPLNMAFSSRVGLFILVWETCPFTFYFIRQKTRFQKSFIDIYHWFGLQYESVSKNNRTGLTNIVNWSLICYLISFEHSLSLFRDGQQMNATSWRGWRVTTTTPTALESTLKCMWHWKGLASTSQDPKLDPAKKPFSFSPCRPDAELILSYQS